MNTKIKELQKVTIPARTKELEEITGTLIPYNIDWTSFKTPQAVEFLDNVSCHRINMAFRGIGADHISKDAIKKTVKGIVLKNIEDITKIKLSFTGGILEMQCAYDKGISGAFSDNQIQKLLMDTMKIQDARKLEELQTKTIPDRLKEFSEIVGTAVPFDIDWSSFHTYTALEFFDNIAILRLNMAFRGVCSDNATKQLVAKKLKKIKFKNVKTPNEKKLVFTPTDGVLEIHTVYDRNSVPSGEGLITDKDIEPYILQQFAVRESQFQLELQEKTIPERTKELAEAYGAPITYEVDYPSFVLPDDYRFVSDCACHRINMAFRTLSSGMKETLIEDKAVTKIKITCVKDEKQKKLTLENGVLHLTCAFAKGLDGCFSDSVIYKLLETKA